jgi:toxin ParE1/3/4
MKQVRFHREAEAELTEAQAWYRSRSEVAAQAFALEIDHAIKSIAETPERSPTGRRGERRFVLSRFPYTVLYRVRADHVFVTAVAHQADGRAIGILASKRGPSLSHRRRSDFWMRPGKVDEPRRVIGEPRDAKREVALRIGRVVRRRVYEVVDRRGWDAHQAVDAGHTIDGEFRHTLRQWNADDGAARRSSNDVDDLVDSQRRGIGELVARDSRGRLSSTQRIESVDDEVARDDVEAVSRWLAYDWQKGHARLTQDPLDCEVRSVEFLRLAGAAVADDDRWPINRHRQS